MFIHKWEPMDEYGNAEGPDIDGLIFLFGAIVGLPVGMLIMMLILGV